MLTQAELKELLHYDPETGLFTWKVKKSSVNPGDKAGSYDLHGYLTVRINYKSYKCHRLAWLYVYGELPIECIDHVNRIRDDNRICNLRCVSKRQNQFNLSFNKKNTSGFTGVSYDKSRNKYEANIQVNKRKIFLGRFDDAISASHAYLLAKSELHAI